MAQYKVPQDVEADDKLIGPFSFRQFIYLIVVVLAGVMAWGLAQIFIGLVIIPLPIILFFGALALPLRKDQPMEIYLAAIVSFYLKPHKRLWDPDGIDSLIEVTAPKANDAPLTKRLTTQDADQRFEYLAGIVDSQGWAIRGESQAPGAQFTGDTIAIAQGAQDILDTKTSPIAQNFDAMINSASTKAHEAAVERMYEPVETQPSTGGATAFTQPSYDPYPRSIHQSVVQPIDDPVHQAYAHPVKDDDGADDKTSSTSSDIVVSPDIMNLANNTDLSVETIAREAHRIQEKEDELHDGDVISLR